MAITQDWIMRQTEMMIEILTRLISTRGEAAAEAVRTDADDLFQRRLMTLLEENDINGAENLLFDELDEDSDVHLRIAVDFYRQLNALDDGRLEAAGFSREEIKSGLEDVMEAYGIELP